MTDLMCFIYMVPRMQCNFLNEMAFLYLYSFHSCVLSLDFVHELRSRRRAFLHTYIHTYIQGRHSQRIGKYGISIASIFALHVQLQSI